VSDTFSDFDQGQQVEHAAHFLHDNHGQEWVNRADDWKYATRMNGDEYSRQATADVVLLIFVILFSLIFRVLFYSICLISILILFVDYGLF
jgi:hypothetical protein